MNHSILGENPTHQHNPQSSTPQTSNSENPLKETPISDNIDVTIMTERSQQIVLDYLLTSQKGEILKRNGQELKKLKMDEKAYNYERGNP